MKVSSEHPSKMHKEIRATREYLHSLFILCCFIISGCVTTTGFTAPRTQIVAAAIAPQTTTSSTVTINKLEAGPFDLVVQKFDDFVRWRKDCNYKPKACVIGDFTILNTSFSDNFAQMITDFAKNNIYARPGHGERKIYIQTITRDVATMSATINGCVYDTMILYLDGHIYDDKISSSLTSWTMLWQNDRWNWVDYQIHKKLFNVNICEP